VTAQRLPDDARGKDNRFDFITLTNTVHEVAAERLGRRAGGRRPAA
jgi:hypothetical protein